MNPDPASLEPLPLPPSFVAEDTPGGGLQFLAPFAASVETALRRYSLGDLLDKRDTLRADLVRSYGHAELLDRMQKDTRDAALAFTLAIGVSGAPFGKGTPRRRVKEFRTLCLYIHARERGACPDASPVPPPAPAPRVEQIDIFTATETPKNDTP